MARTRAQAQAEGQGKSTSTHREEPKAKAKNSKTKKEKGSTEQHSDTVPRKRSPPKDTEASKAKETQPEPDTKRQKTSSPKSKSSEPAISKDNKSKLDKLIDQYGHIPLADLGLKDPEKATSETVFAHIFNALLSSGRIGHDIAHKTLQCLINAQYHNLETLKKSTWEERTEILTEGGYTHYREKTATYLGELAELIEEKYDGDAAKILPKKEEATDVTHTQKTVEKALKEIKGLGPLGADIFLGTIQVIYPYVAPFVGKRDVEVAKEIGLGSVEEMWESVGKGNKRIGMLCAALTKVRLNGKIKTVK